MNKTKEIIQEKKLTFFDIVNNINSSRSELSMCDIEDVYNQFMINRALSNNKDTVLIANELNIRSNISNQMHYDFLYHIIPKRKRYGKWNKKTTEFDEEIKIIMDNYGYSYNKAKDVIGLVDINLIKKSTGGIEKNNRKNKK